MSPPTTKVKRLATQVFVGAYLGVTAASDIERLITNEEWDAQSVICTNMAICTKDIAGCTKIRELGNPAALEAASKGAILGGLIGSVSQLMVGASRRPSVLSVANDTSLLNEEKATFASRRPSIVAKVAAHNIGSMDKNRLAKIGAALIPGSSSIICVFDEVLVKESDYATQMQDHRAEMSDLTEHVVNKITEQLRAGCDVAFHIVVDENSGDISWTRTVVGEDAIQVRDIVMSHDSLAVEEVTTTTIGRDENNQKKEETTETVVLMTPDSISTARTLLRNSVCAYEISYEELIEDYDEENDEDPGKVHGNQTYETGVIHERNDGTKDVMYERSTVQANGEATYEKTIKIGNVTNQKGVVALPYEEEGADKAIEDAPFDEV
mmetsp:Transcript_43110/g.48806  ORF Transcript_43110/g.48806 Transcript_43110/m.48806 type:complete len:381 (-) Transcript_43110:481-1623(-)